MVVTEAKGLAQTCLAKRYSDILILGYFFYLFRLEKCNFTTKLVGCSHLEHSFGDFVILLQIAAVSTFGYLGHLLCF